MSDAIPKTITSLSLLMCLKLLIGGFWNNPNVISFPLRFWCFLGNFGWFFQEFDDLLKILIISQLFGLQLITEMHIFRVFNSIKSPGLFKTYKIGNLLIKCIFKVKLKISEKFLHTTIVGFLTGIPFVSINNFYTKIFGSLFAISLLISIEVLLYWINSKFSLDLSAKFSAKSTTAWDIWYKNNESIYWHCWSSTIIWLIWLDSIVT